LRIADFGSAVDAETVQPGVGLYPGAGPTDAEETAEYQPPEASLGGAPFHADDPRTYDLWSAGILILELLLATPDVLPLSNRAAATLQLRYGGQPAAVLRRLKLANALAEHCITPAQGGNVGSTGRGSSHDMNSAVNSAVNSATQQTDAEAAAAPMQLRRLAHSCGLSHFMAAVQRHDPLPSVLGELSKRRDSGDVKVGRLDEGLLELAWRLLRWHPVERLTAADALRHPSLLNTPTARDTSAFPFSSTSFTPSAAATTAARGSTAYKLTAEGTSALSTQLRQRTAEEERGISSWLRGGDHPLSWLASWGSRAYSGSGRLRAQQDAL